MKKPISNAECINFDSSIEKSKVLKRKKMFFNAPKLRSHTLLAYVDRHVPARYVRRNNPLAKRGRIIPITRLAEAIDA